MKIHLVTVGQKMPAWVEAGYYDYAKRLPADNALHLVEIPLLKRSRHSNIEKIIAEEGNRMLAKIPAQSHIIALDERGELWHTQELAKQLQHWRMQGSDVYLLVGGPDGLAPACLEKARQHWSLSRLTLPHPLIRIIIVEQLYRAWSISTGHPYHRGQ